MRFLPSIAGALVVLALPAAASAAPRAEDFSRPVVTPGAARAASATVTVSPGRRFDVVGLRWRSAPRTADLELRVRDGGRWRKWVHVPRADAGAHGSDPVWAGGADALQLRGTRGVKGLRAHFIRVSGKRHRPRPVARAAAGEQPPIVPRSEWAGNQCPPRSGPSMGTVQMAFVHHTVSANTYGPEDSEAMVLGICRFHRNNNGWNDIGYNFLVDKYGTIFEGRAGGIDQPVVGAQAQGWNSNSTGIANLGTYQDVPQSDAAIEAMANLIAWKLPLHGVPVSGEVTVESAGGETNRYPSGRFVTFDRISGHRDGDSTECPGEQLYAQLPRLRELAAQRAPQVIPGTPMQAGTMTLQAAGTQLAFPEPVRLSGRLTDPSGAPVANARVRLQILTSKGFRSIGAAVVTNGDGVWTAELPTNRNRVVRATVGDVVSPRITVSVRPMLTAKVPGPRVLAGRRAVVTGTIEPNKAKLVVEVARERRGRYVRIGTYRTQSRGKGRFRAAVPLTRPGLYRLRVRFAGDTLNTSAVAADLYVRAVRRASSLGGAAAPAAR